MRQWYELTVPAVIGDDEQDEEETILNRTLKIADGGLEYAVDPRHEQQIRAKYCGIAARANYLHRIASICNLRRRRLADKCQPGPAAIFV